MKITQAVTLLLLAASTAALPQVVRAEQTANVAAEDAATTRTFTLRNISKERMLFWLQPMPDTKDVGRIPLPKDLMELRVAEIGNALVARGSNDALDKIQNIIESLDQQLQVVECDVHLIFAAHGELQKTLQAENGKIPNDTGSSFTIQKRETMEALMLSPGAYVMSGKILTFNNMMATVPLQKNELTDVKSEKNAPLPPLQITLTPTINRDGTVTIGAQVKATPFFEISTMWNVKNDGTLYIQGPIHEKLGAALEAAGAPRAGDVVIAVTPHILRKEVASQEK